MKPKHRTKHKRPRLCIGPARQLMVAWILPDTLPLLERLAVLLGPCLSVSFPTHNL